MHPKLKGVALMKLDEKELFSLNVHVLTSKYKQMDCLNFSSQWLLRGQLKILLSMAHHLQSTLKHL